jgi:IPT/TIG domain-containing protein
MGASRSLLIAASCLLALFVFGSSALRAQTVVQVNSAAPSSASQVAVTYAQAQVSGDLNIVVVGWKDTIAAVSSVTDISGNVYTLAVGPTILSGQLSQSIYFARNIVAAPAASNAVSVTFSSTATSPDVRILEYSGLDANNPLDAATGSSGSTATTDSGAVNTTNANDLIIGASVVSTSTAAPGTGFTARLVTTPNGDLVEDELVTAAGSYRATSTLSTAGAWIMQVVAFKVAGAPPAPSAPGNLTAVAASNSEIDLSWIAATGGTISSYLIERCQGAGCTNFAQIGTSAAITFSDLALPGGTSFTYRVRAKDSANNLGPYSNSATAATQGLPSPTAPGNLTAVAGTLAPVVVGVQGYINSTSQVTHTTAAFDSTGGDLLVLFASSHAGVTFTPSDSFGNVWISAAGPTSTTVGFDLRSQLWYARNPIVGPNDTVTMTLSVAQPLVMSIIVVKGSNLSAPMDVISAIGSDNGTQSVNIASPGISTTAGNELLIGFAKVSNTSVFQPGAGFTQQAGGSSNYLDAETGLAATAGTYSATFTVGAPVTWQAVVVAVSAAAASNPNQVNLSWTASSETGGSISSYLVERCQGVGCTGFSQIGSSATTVYSDSGVTGSTTYSYRVRAQDSSSNVGPYSNTATVTTPAGVPAPSITSLSPTSGPVGTAVTITGVNFGATQGTSTVSFNGAAATATSWSSTSIVAPVPTGATTGNVTVTVGGQTSNGVIFTIAAAPPPGTITHLQQASNSDITGRTFTSFSATFPAATTSGNAMIVGVTYGNTNPTITATDSQGNTYTRAIASYDLGHNQGCAILYATNTKGNAPNTVTVNFSGAVAYLALGIHEYSGVAGLSALDTTAGNKGSGTSPSSGTATTTANGDLIFGCVAEDATGLGDSFTAGSGFTKRVDLGMAAAYADEDGVQAVAGAVAATWSLSPSRDWVASLAAFRGAGGSTGPSITSLAPATGPVGTSVTITGANFGATQGTSTVKFNGTVATVTSWSSTSIVALVPPGAATGSVTVTVGGQASNGVVFTVSP